MQDTTILNKTTKIYSPGGIVADRLDRIWLGRLTAEQRTPVYGGTDGGGVGGGTSGDLDVIVVGSDQCHSCPEFTLTFQIRTTAKKFNPTQRVEGNQLTVASCLVKANYDMVQYLAGMQLKFVGKKFQFNKDQEKFISTQRSCNGFLG